MFGHACSPGHAFAALFRGLRVPCLVAKSSRRRLHKAKDREKDVREKRMRKRASLYQGRTSTLVLLKPSRRKAHPSICSPRSRSWGGAVMRRKRIASSALILSSCIAFAPAAIGQRQAGNGYRASNGAVAVSRSAPALRAVAVPQAMAAPTHVQAQASHAPTMIRTPAGSNAPTRTSVRVTHAHGAAAPSATRAGSAAISVHRAGPAGIQPHRLNVMSGLGHLPLSNDFADSPGLGFDFSHFAAINGGVGLNERRFRDRENAGVPFGFSGFLLSPEVIVVEGQQARHRRLRRKKTQTRTRKAARLRSAKICRINSLRLSLGPAAPVRDAAEFVFVRRDGSLVFAVGYSWDHGVAALHHPRRIAPQHLAGCAGHGCHAAVQRAARRKFPHAGVSSARRALATIRIG